MWIEKNDTIFNINKRQDVKLWKVICEGIIDYASLE
jgi:hypothetical protein